MGLGSARDLNEAKTKEVIEEDSNENEDSDGLRVYEVGADDLD